MLKHTIYRQVIHTYANTHKEINTHTHIQKPT